VKTALITTTVNVPTVLALYRKLDPSVKFYVAADEKTPLEAYAFCAEIPDCEIYSPDRQKELGYECSALLGWNNDSRRNIALLEALKDGAELIISIDDDMIPYDCVESRYRNKVFGFYRHFAETYAGLQLGLNACWFDAGQFTAPPAKQRGLPPDIFSTYWNPLPVVDAKIGVAQGIILGVPDTDASTAMTNRPHISSVTDILRNGFVVDPNCITVFNSQLTCFRRELAPAFAQFYNHQGRNTDIFASLLMRRIMRDRGLYTYFGPPMAFHARTPRPLFKDLKAEMFGLEYIQEWAEYLNRAPTMGSSNVIDNCARLMDGFSAFSDDNKEVARAWYNDCEKVL
jgi:hypothetical protein